MTAPVFAERTDEEAVETGTALMPKFDRDGLIVAIAADVATGEVLMVAHMNQEALARTIATGEAWFWSRSREKLWRKGEESGNTLSVAELRVDCDQDAILLKVARRRRWRRLPSGLPLVLLPLGAAWAHRRHWRPSLPSTGR